MNIYAIKDLLIGYYMTPFLGPSDREVMSAVANLINSGAKNDAIAQAPHHFQLWKLATVEEEGVVRPAKEHVCDCSALIRTGLRKEPGLTGSPETPETAPASEGVTADNSSGRRTQQRA